MNFWKSPDEGGDSEFFNSLLGTLSARRKELHVADELMNRLRLPLQGK